MTTFDLTPLLRSTVGFDRLSRMLEASALDSAPSYPPYNIVALDEDNYRITMAVAGFSQDDLDITAKENQLVVAGRVAERNKVDENAVYLHRGIAERAFERRFQLADHIRVVGATMENGLLTVELVREIPEAMKPRKIEIGTGSASSGSGLKTLLGKRSA